MITKLDAEQMKELKHFMLVAQISTIGTEISVMEQKLAYIEDKLEHYDLSEIQLKKFRKELEFLKYRHEILVAQRTKLHNVMDMVKNGNI